MTNQELTDKEIEIADDVIFDIANTRWSKWYNADVRLDSIRITSDESTVLRQYVDSSITLQNKPSAELDSAISKSHNSKEIYVQRWLTKENCIRDFGADVFEQYINNDFSAVKEKTVTIKGYMSCSDYNSSYGNYLSQFSKDNVLLYIYVPKGTEMVVFNTYWYPMGLDNEHEILIGRNHKIRLLGMGSKRKVLMCEIIG